MAFPSLQVNLILPVAFLVNVALLDVTNIDTGLPDSCILFIIKAPVENSAAIPCTAQNIDLNGFLFTHLWVTPTIHVSLSICFVLTPHK